MRRLRLDETNPDGIVYLKDADPGWIYVIQSPATDRSYKLCRGDYVSPESWRWVSLDSSIGLCGPARATLQDALENKLRVGQVVNVFLNRQELGEWLAGEGR